MVVTICLIDNKPVFGTDNGLPKSQLTELIISFNGKEIALNTDFMYDPSWNEELKKEQFKLEKDEIGINLIGNFSDGAGTYIVTWKIIEDMAFRLSIENGN